MGNTTTKAVKAGMAYTAGNILLRGISFFTLPIFSRILTTEEFGLFNIYVAYETILTIFAGICIYGSLRTAKYDFEKEFGEYGFSVLHLSMAVFTGILLLGNMLFPLYQGAMGFSRLVINLLIFHSYAMFLFQFYNVKLALDYRFGKYLVVSSLNSVLGTVISIGLILFVFEKDKHLARIFGYGMVPVVIGAVLLAGMLKQGYVNNWKPFAVKYWRYAVTISLPLVVHTFSQQILAQFDRIMIQKVVNVKASGIYSFISTFSNILQIIIQSMDNAWSVWFYEQLHQKKYKDITEKMKAYIILMNIMYIGFITISPDIIRAFGTSDYAEGIAMIVPLSLSIYFMFLYSLPVHVEYFYKKTKYIAMGTSCAAGANFILNLICIARFGYQAAAWTTLVSYMLLYLFHQLIAGKLEKERIFPRKTICLSLLLLLGFSFWIIFCIDKFTLRWLSMIFAMGFLFVCYRRLIMSMLSMVPGLNRLIERQEQKDES